MSIWQEIVGKFVRPTVHPSRTVDFQLVAFDDDDSDFSGSSIDSVEPIAGLAVVIEYGNAKGEKATRLITCRRLDVHGELRYISAFCHSREALRKFRVDRISEVFDHQSGESLGNAFSFFEKFSPDGIERSPMGFGLSVKRRADLMALLNALVFVARCDQEYHPLERSVLDKLLTRFWLRLELSGEPDEAAILRLADRLAPDAETFWVSIQRLAADQRLAKILLEGAKEVIAADGMMTKEEFYWGSKLDQFFRENAGN